MEQTKTAYQKFKEKNAEKINMPIICDVCNQPYTYYTKHNHLKSKTHINCQNIVNKLQGL